MTPVTSREIQKSPPDQTAYAQRHQRWDTPPGRLLYSERHWVMAHLAFRCGLHVRGHVRSIALKNCSQSQSVLGGLLGLLLCCSSLPAAEPTPPRANLNQPRTGQTQKFGSGTLTHRSDGTSSQTQPFGSGSITTERNRDGKTITGHTQKFGSGTVTRWSDGSTTETRPFGSGSLTTERGRDGKTVTGHTQKFGSGTITNRSDGSSTRTEKFGSGALQRDQPGRKSR